MSAMRGKGCNNSRCTSSNLSRDAKLTTKHDQQKHHRVQNLNDLAEKAPALVDAKRWIVLPGTVFSLLVATLVLSVPFLKEGHERGGEDDAHCEVEDDRDEFQHGVLDVGSQLFREEV